MRSTLVFALMLGLASAPKVHAAACCTSATAFGTGRLLMWESWAAGLRSSMTHELGFFDDNGRYEGNEANVVDRYLRTDFYALVGLSESASVFAVVPFVGTRVSDVQLGYRHQVIAIGEYEGLPSLALTASALFPSGTPRSAQTEKQEISGRGLYAGMLGASLEKTWMPFFAQLNLGASLLSSLDMGWQIAGALGMEVTDTLVMSGLAQWSYEAPRRYRTQLGLSGSWRFNPHMTAQLSASTDVMAKGFGANWPGGVTYGFGLRYGYF